MALAIVAGCALAGPAPASADLTTLLASCTLKDARDGDTVNGNTFPFRLCDDGVPGQGGTTANLGAVNAVAVPAAYTGEGQPVKDAAASLLVPGNSAGDIAIDADISLPDPTANPMPAGGYPLVVMMHGCCSGNKTSWEATTIDGGGAENWHYNNAWFASRGYVVLTYTSRGFVNGSNQGSTGQTQLDSDLFEINDYQHMAGQLADLADLDPGADVVKVDPQKIVPTGGSYGGGFTWMALTDPTWKSPGDKDMKVVAAAAKYGWTNLVESLVPRGDDRRDALPPTDPVAQAALPIGFPKRTINSSLYAQGKTGVPPGSAHTTFAADIDAAQTCLLSADPYEQNPLCTTTLSTALPRFINERSAYFQNSFFTGLANTTIDPVPVFSAGTTTDKLFPAAEHRRMVERLKATVSGYPVQEYYGDYNHFVQNKRKEWSDLCGADHHPCAYADYPGADPKDLDAEPPSQVREDGVTTRLNRFIDHYAKPPGNPSEPAPAFDVTASLQTCPDNVAPGFPLDEPGQRFTAADFASLAPGRLNVNVTGSQPTANDIAPNSHAARADPVANTASNSSRCVVENAPGGLASAGLGVATYDSDTLPGEFTMVGQTRLTVQHTGAGAGLQLNARLYDLYPDGRQVLVDRGVRRLESANGPTVIDIHGAGWRFPAGHRLRLELAQDDDPYVKSSVQPGSLVVAGVAMSVPVRGTGATVGGRVPAQPTSGPAGSAGAARLRAGFGRIRGAIGVRRGSFRIRCRATGTQLRTCRVAARAILRRGRTRRIGAGRATLRAGRRSVLVRVRLNRLGRRLLARNRSRRGLKVRVDLRVTERLTNRTAVKRKRYRLRVARR